jgi:hypothetical protein
MDGRIEHILEIKDLLAANQIAMIYSCKHDIKEHPKGTDLRAARQLLNDDKKVIR